MNKKPYNEMEPVKEDKDKKLNHKCPECKSDHIASVDDTGILYCMDCGLVLTGYPPLNVNSTRITYDWGLTYW